MVDSGRTHLVLNIRIIFEFKRVDIAKKTKKCAIIVM